MKLPNTLILDKKQAALGFTMLEVLIVVGLLAIFAGMGLVYSFDSYRGEIFRGEYTNVASVVARARNRAINNFNESGHGVTITGTEYRLYPTATYNAADPSTYESFPRNANVTMSGDSEIIFEQLTGNSICGSVTCSKTVGISYGTLSNAVLINEVGGIDW